MNSLSGRGSIHVGISTEKLNYRNGEICVADLPGIKGERYVYYHDHFYPYKEGKFPAVIKSLKLFWESLLGSDITPVEGNIYVAEDDVVRLSAVFYNGLFYNLDDRLPIELLVHEAFIANLPYGVDVQIGNGGEFYTKHLRDNRLVRIYKKVLPGQPVEA